MRSVRQDKENSTISAALSTWVVNCNRVKKISFKALKIRTALHTLELGDEVTYHLAAC